MRTIAVLVFAWNLAGQIQPAKQPAPQRPDRSAPIEVLENFLKQHPEDAPTRIALLHRYFDAPEGALPLDTVRRGRRRQILWLIEHQPEAPDLGGPAGVLDPKGRFADPDGYNEAAKLWYSRAAVPGAPPKLIANAIFFFRFDDRQAAHDLLEYGLKAHPKDNDLARMQGMLDAMTFLGATEADFRGNVTAVDGTGVKSPAAIKAREQIESAVVAALAGGAGQFLLQQAGFLNRELVLGDQDALELAERWFDHAHQLDPKDGAWIEGLMQVYQRDAALALDPHAKVQYLSKALEIADTHPRQIRVLNERMEAEFNAGDLDAAGQDAGQLLDLVTVNAELGNFDAMIHSGETMLGRVALAQGKVAEAKQHLAESAKVKSNFVPKMTLAQDLLDAGERDAVVQYLEACRSFWKFDEGRIDHAEKLIRTESKPDILSPWRPGSSLIRKKAPALDLTDLGGKEWKLDQTGGRPVAILFWKIDCAACRDQLRLLGQIATANHVMLAVNEGDDEARLREYIAKNRLTLPVAIGTKDVARQYEAEAMPSLVVIDRAGEVAAYSAGSISPDTLRAQLAKGIAGMPRLAAPVPIGQTQSADCTQVKFSWQPVSDAESYVVEWDTPFENGWLSERQQGRLNVIPTRETSTELECPHGCNGRWRVYAVSVHDGSGPSSDWREFSCQ